MNIIPLSQLPSQTLSVILGGQNCTLSLYWRQERLYLDLVSGAVTVCKGAICQDRTDVVQSPSQNFTGTLMFIDTQGNRPPRWEELGKRYLLVYAAEGGV